MFREHRTGRMYGLQGGWLQEEGRGRSEGAKKRGRGKTARIGGMGVWRRGVTLLNHKGTKGTKGTKRGKGREGGEGRRRRKGWGGEGREEVGGQVRLRRGGDGRIPFSSFPALLPSLCSVLFVPLWFKGLSSTPRLGHVSRVRSSSAIMPHANHPHPHS